MTIEQLQAQHRTKMAEARALHQKIKGDLPEAEARGIEREFNLIMAEVDDLRDKIEAAKDAASTRSGDPRAPRGGDAEARGVDDGLGDGTFDGDSGAQIAPEQRCVAWAEARGQDAFSRLPVGRYLRSMVTGAETDLEKRALSEGSDSAGGYTVPTHLSARLIDTLRAASVVTRAGAKTVMLDGMTNNIARLAADPTPAWRAESAAVALSDPTFDNVQLVPRSLAVMTKVSVELLQDSINLEAELPRILAASLASELDRVALLGSGTAPEPRGIANTSGIGTSAVAAAIKYGDLARARTAILTANAGPVSAFIMHPRDEGALTGATDGTGQPLNQPAVLANIPMLTTTAIPVDGGTGTNESAVFAGNFAHLLIGVRSDIRIEVIREAFMGNLQYAFIAHLRADVAAQHPGAFYALTGVTPT
ncbi:phage major capsid protein [Paenirhodobacter sp. CAU 1674]|uniref:phage major capsid protein n=1 Tax=Paenirhodobacter sp. CAU 1674 TaxID=3032596 RepID=UPI0023DBFC97|nr:phage major capsid protein [Paenirhodobacter sp. CAU 1674]MDF2140805.1 phage major capsid protein [Paenirhodobacter sp. CAU 1674]